MKLYNKCQVILTINNFDSKSLILREIYKSIKIIIIICLVALAVEGMDSIGAIADFPYPSAPNVRHHRLSPVRHRLNVQIG